MPRKGPLVWASVKSGSKPGLVSLTLTNSSSKRVIFWVQGVIPRKTGFELDGNTQWSTEVPKDPSSRIVDVREGNTLGRELAYEEIS